MSDTLPVIVINGLAIPQLDFIPGSIIAAGTTITLVGGIPVW